ncbi:uncharacterized protein LOC122071804 isoform X2 [Macadamia integrifolia]|uniref:uncharacterized protein LOC122071804 isoform X2 n=1 Tax=Macadamia integrifolia TaxID=60698 RepID=UPI001C502273|nr:uncharacterized protein LOC122071804 isoform X2 [Macadamia integrifolia]
MASTEGLVPITRTFLSRYYDKYPFPAIPEDVFRLSTQLRSMSNDLQKEFPLNEAEIVLAREADCPPPHKIDENMWKNREHIEEILSLLEKSHWPRMLQQQYTPEDKETAIVLEDLKTKLHNSLKILESFQSKNAESVFNTVMTYVPQDFRGTIIRQQRERSERNKQVEVDALVNSGGSIRDRYALLWKQQMERRRQLAQLGSATGIYKTLVKYLVGVPQVLLDFIRQINDDQGPMEEQRERYGPSLYSLTTMVLSIRLFLHLLWGRFEARNRQKDEVSVLEQAVLVYTSELERFIKFIGDVFANSPFLISAEDAGAAEARKSDDYREIIIPAGRTHEVSLTVESVNSYIAWDFSVTQGKMNMLILPYRRCEYDQGNFCTCMAGCYKLIWDNSYSAFFKKGLRYKVDSIPPVADPAESPRLRLWQKRKNERLSQGCYMSTVCPRLKDLMIHVIHCLIYIIFP